MQPCDAVARAPSWSQTSVDLSAAGEAVRNMQTLCNCSTLESEGIDRLHQVAVKSRLQNCELRPLYQCLVGVICCSAQL